MRRIRCDEKSLVRKACGGDRESFGKLVELHKDRVYNLAFRLTGSPDAAWDLSQDAFLKAWEAMASFRGASGFYTWIYRILLNLHMNREKSLGRRMERRTRSMDARFDGGGGPALKDCLEGPNAEGPAERVMRMERAEAVQAALSRLPSRHRQVLLLRDMEGLSYEEIAGLLRLPLGTVRSRLFRAREAMKRILEEGP